jgi:hypothetical protein
MGLKLELSVCELDVANRLWENEMELSLPESEVTLLCILVYCCWALYSLCKPMNVSLASVAQAPTKPVIAAGSIRGTVRRQGQNNTRNTNGPCCKKRATGHSDGDMLATQHSHHHPKTISLVGLRGLPHADETQSHYKAGLRSHSVLLRVQ